MSEEKGPAGAETVIAEIEALRQDPSYPRPAQASGWIAVIRSLVNEKAKLHAAVMSGSQPCQEKMAEIIKERDDARMQVIERDMDRAFLRTSNADLEAKLQTVRGMLTPTEQERDHLAAACAAMRAALIRCTPDGEMFNNPGEHPCEESDPDECWMCAAIAAIATDAGREMLARLERAEADAKEYLSISRQAINERGAARARVAELEGQNRMLHEDLDHRRRARAEAEQEAARLRAREAKMREAMEYMETKLEEDVVEDSDLESIFDGFRAALAEDAGAAGETNSPGISEGWIRPEVAAKVLEFIIDLMVKFQQLGVDYEPGGKALTPGYRRALDLLNAMPGADDAIRKRLGGTLQADQLALLAPEGGK